MDSSEDEAISGEDRKYDEDRDVCMDEENQAVDYENEDDRSAILLLETAAEHHGVCGACKELVFRAIQLPCCLISSLLGKHFLKMFEFGWKFYSAVD